MNPIKTIGLLAPLALASSLSAQALLFSFDSGVQGWSATTWNGAVQSVAWDAGSQSLAASITEGGWHYLANIWTNTPASPVYQAFNAGFANPTMSTISFDVTVLPGTGGTYLNTIGVLQGGTTGGWNQLQFTGFNQSELSTGATKTFFTDFTLDTGTNLAGTGEANYQFVIGVNSDWSGGTIRVDNVRLAPAAIPEPSTYAALFGAGALGLAIWRRRCRG